MDVEYDREMLIWNNCVNMKKAIDYNCKEFTLSDEAVSGNGRDSVSEISITQMTHN